MDHFRNQTPWYGPYIAYEGYDTLCSSALSNWPSGEYNLIGWIFDEAGRLIAEKQFVQGAQSEKPISLDLRKEFFGLSPMRGTIGLLTQPTQPEMELSPIDVEWTLRLCARTGLCEVISTGISLNLNFSQESSRPPRFRLFSGALTITGGWRPIAYLINASANPNYSKYLNLQVSVFNPKGESLHAPGPVLAPFGSVWLDLMELFGQPLVDLLSQSNGRGSYSIRSDDGSCIGYHFLFHPETGRIGGDHTRPLLRYLSSGYGITPQTLRPTLRDFLRHALHLFREQIGRLRGFLQGMLSSLCPQSLIPSYLDYFRLRPFVFAVWFHFRKGLWLFKSLFFGTPVLHQIEFLDESSKSHLIRKVIPHNKRLVWRISRYRTERLINLLRSVGGLDTKRSKILCIGPRNEAELLLFSLYGFPLRNITAIDLISYSPFIQVMDMHELKFPDGIFDIVYNSFVVCYSNDIRKACAEMIRVAKEAGLIAVGFVYNATSDVTGTPFSNGLKDLFSYFDGCIKHVYWQEEWPQPNGEITASTIFSVRKS